jgi:predicted AlkP superfamily pyrophosphatase or phosphodiesterase
VVRPLLVLDVVGLTPRLLREKAPRLRALFARGFASPMSSVLPAVTCPAQATMLTGLLPREHGIVGNGWYFRDLAEILFWRQSHALMAGEKVWEAARRRDPSVTCAKLFWWFNLYASADYAVTPRPFYPADGRKIPGIYAWPPDLEADLDARLGTFPLFRFWGPGADLVSTEWIAACAKRVLERHAPTLALVYLPHLDYDFQRHGPDDPRALAAVEAVDRVAADLAAAWRERGAEVVVVSEYGIGAVTGWIAPNRALREAGLLRARPTPHGELLDAGASRAFAVCDHQVAHVYVRDAADLPRARAALLALPGVERLLGEEEKRAVGLDHPRSGELVAVAARDRWFAYPYWFDDAAAPDFARTVDIHRKPGYDPAELFLDPKRRLVKARLAARLLQKALGFRYLLDVVPLDPSPVRGSHGRTPDDPEEGPLYACTAPGGAADRVEIASVKARILGLLFGARGKLPGDA